MLYRILKFLIGLGIRIYYREIKVINQGHLQSKKPLIIIANHPNTLMDAWVIGMVCKQPIYYMAKATLFDSRFKLYLLKSLNMIPINRKGEGEIKGVNNDDSLEECYRVLEEGKTLVIFPEGTSYKERVLRKLKTGTARIALETERRNDGKLGLEVVAVGLNYSQPEKFRSKILIHVDKPKKVLPYLEEYKTNEIEAARTLTDDFRISLEKVLLTVESNEDELLIDQLYKLLNSKYEKNSKRGINQQLVQLKDIKAKIDELKLLEPWRLNEIELRMKATQWKLEKLKIRAEMLDRNLKFWLFVRQLFTSLLFILVAFPLFIYGAIIHIVPFQLTDYIIPKLSKDIEYYAPFAVLLGIVFYPLNYAIILYVVGYLVFGLSTNAIILVLLSFPLAGLFAYWFVAYLKHISFKWRYLLLMVDRKNALKELQKEKQSLRKLVFE